MKMKRLVSAIAALAMSVSSLVAFAAEGDVTTVLSNALTDSTALTDTDAYTWGADVAGLVTAGSGVILTNNNSTANNYENKDFVTFTEVVGDATHKVNVSYNLYSIKDKGQAVTNYIMSYYDAAGNLLFSISEGNGGWAYPSTLTYADSATTTATASLNSHMAKATTTSVSFEVTFTDSGNLLTIDGASYAFVGGGIKDVKLSVSGGQDYGRGTYVSNYLMTTTEVAAATPVDYTINYIYNGETVSTATGTGMVDTDVTADNVVTTADGVKYFAADDATLTMTLVKGENVLNVDLREANSYTITVNAVGDVTKEIKTETILEGDSKDVVWPMYIVEDGVGYEATVYGGTYYGTTVSNPTADTTIEVTYTKKYEDVAVYDELDGSTANFANVRCSNGSALDNAAYTSSVDLEPGVYTVLVRYSKKGRGATLTVGDTLIMTAESASGAWTTTTVENVTVTEAAPLVWNAGASGTYDAIDTVLVYKTGEYTPEPTSIDGTIAWVADFTGDAYEGEATALTATFDVPEDTTYESVTVAMADGSASVTKTAEDGITIVTGGQVVYGIVVNSIVTADALTAVAQ